MAFDLTGRKALITGGTAGIGLAVAKRFVNNGAQVVISGRRDTGHAIAAEIGASFIQADVSIDQQVVALFDQAEEQLGAVNVVVNNAGIAGEGGLMSDSALSDFDRIIAINLRAAYHVLHLAAKRMGPGGSIINTASISGMSGFSGTSIYCASKAAIVHLTKAAALELAHRHIRVNAVSPGLIESEIWGGEMPDQLARMIVPLGRVGKGDEAAAVFQFLASEESAYVTGSNYLVDGGHCAGLTPQDWKKKT